MLKVFSLKFFLDKKVLNDAEKYGKFWSKWVDNIWDENCSYAFNLNFVKDLFDIDEHTFIVLDTNNKSNTWKVYYFDDKPHEY